MSIHVAMILKKKITGKKTMIKNRFCQPVSATSLSHLNRSSNYDTSSGDSDDDFPTSGVLQINRRGNYKTANKVPRIVLSNDHDVVEKNRKGYPVTADKVPRKIHFLQPDKASCDISVRN